MSEKVIIGSRESRLAVTQSEMVQQYIQEKNPGLSVEILTMKTTGDKILNQPLEKIGGKGLFVRELDAALLEGRSDLSVHSLKDVPMELPCELPLIAFSAREDVRDALILPEGVTELDFSKPVGCSSKRRMLQLAALYPQATFAPIRGNVQTRLRKLDSGEYSATILAAAGLKRLGLAHRISRYFTIEEMIPAAGQGILAVQGCLSGSGGSPLAREESAGGKAFPPQGSAERDYSYLDGYSDPASEICALAERAFVRALGGSCSTPVAAYARIVVPSGSEADMVSSDGGSILRLDAFYCDESTGRIYRGSEYGNPDAPQEAGKKLARRFME
ncbi:MAG: hydroxymethylbilane synthase [Lachnospiraceae bacterium]|nr:hydroxymethylbilane synthase [Lachnospiraceae bacterium]